MNLADSDNFRELFLNNTPLLDVRAPVEFAQGAFPGAVNIPLLDDEQRHEVGIEYKQKGQDAAIALGNQLATESIRSQRLRDWTQFVEAHPQGYLYCFRGGLRSRTAQQWLKASGVEYPLIKGGYKAMRGFLIQETERLTNQFPMVAVTGLTGTAKTVLINELANSIDLEGLAHHRGSAFGKRAKGQPAQIDFENQLAIQLMQREHQGISQLVVEDEGRMIGRVNMPLPLRQKMTEIPLVVVEADWQTRFEQLRQDYVVADWPEYRDLYGDDEGWHQYGESLLKAIDGIKKRLGGECHLELRALIEQGVISRNQQTLENNLLAVITVLMKQYYDPMYHYQMKQKAQRVIFRGTREEVREFLS